jgi:uncharacterized protein (TIGR03067 family)
MRHLLAVVLIAAFAAAAPVPKAVKKRDDQDLILGRWKPVEGQTQWYQFNADGTLSTWYNPAGPPATPQYRFVLDPTASPKRITWVGATSGKAEWEGIYELNGDSLKVAYSPVPKVPEGFGPGQSQSSIEQTRDTSAK